jgi:hypothetical protein
MREEQMKKMAKCLYCFKEIDPMKVHFRAQDFVAEKSAVSVSESEYFTAMKNSTEQGRVRDNELYNYFLAHDIDADTARANATKYPSIDPEKYAGNVEVCVKTNDGIKYASKITLDKTFFSALKHETNERLCPHCHNTLPHGYGTRDSALISIIGDTNSGKTVFIAVLMNLLRGQGVGNLKTTLNTTLDPKASNYETINENIDIIFTKRTVPVATNTLIDIMPLAYAMTYEHFNSAHKATKKTIDLVLYDIAGEACSDSKLLEKKGQNIVNSDGLVFLLDPMSFKIYRDWLKANKPDAFRASQDSGDSSKTLGIDRIYGMLDALFQYFEGGERIRNIPVALVVSKADLLIKEATRHEGHFARFKNTIPYTDKNEGGTASDGYLDKADIMRLNTHTRELVGTFSGNDPTLFCRMFTNTSFFLSSALNQIPVPREGGGSARLNDDIRPYRVADSLLWILAMKGLIPYHHAPEPKAKKNLLQRLFPFLR